LGKTRRRSGFFGDFTALKAPPFLKTSLSPAKASFGLASFNRKTNNFSGLKIGERLAGRWPKRRLWPVEPKSGSRAREPLFGVTSGDFSSELKTALWVQGDLSSELKPRL
jgi:hypothetical protein